MTSIMWIMWPGLGMGVLECLTGEAESAEIKYS